MPWELEGAAYIDGAGLLRVFFSIMLPLAQPALVVSFLFSFVWHWNDTFEPSIYLTDANKFFLNPHLNTLESTMRALHMLLATPGRSWRRRCWWCCRYWCSIFLDNDILSKISKGLV